MIGCNRRGLASSARNQRAIFAAYAATVVVTCSTTSGVAKPSENASSAFVTTLVIWLGAAAAVTAGWYRATRRRST